MVHDMFLEQPDGRSIRDFSPDDRNLIALLGRKTDLVVELLAERGITVPKSADKRALRQRLKGLIAGGVLDENDIAKLLDRLQGWGRQQIYLYDVEIADANKCNWLDDEWVRERFAAAGLSDLFNARRQFDATDEPTLFESSYCSMDGLLVFRWAEDIGVLVPKPSLDKVEQFSLSDDAASFQRMIYRAYLQEYSVDISAVEWNIESGAVCVFIRQVSNRNYKQVKDRFFAEVGQVFPSIGSIKPVNLRTVIANLPLIPDLNSRYSKVITEKTGSSAEFRSGGNEDLFQDPDVQRAHKQLMETGDATGHSVQWPLKRGKRFTVNFVSRIHDDQRIRIDAQLMERDVRHVLRQLRRVSK